MLFLVSSIVDECVGHSKQADTSLLATKGLYVPRAQLWQVAFPGSALNVPDAHGTQAWPTDGKPVYPALHMHAPVSELPGML